MLGRLGRAHYVGQNLINEHIMSDRLSCSLNPKYKNIVQVKNANLKKDNNNNTGAEQPLTIDVRLERRPEKTCHKNPLGKKRRKLGIRRNHGSCPGSW